MHDGYIFTLGICGSTRAGHPALMLLEAMLRELPPVKRAAHLGEVLLLEQDQQLHDPLRDPLRADMRDAEVLLIVTPLHTATLPFRLAALLDYASDLAATGELRGKIAVLVGIGPGTPPEPASLALLQRFCDDAGITVAGKLVLTEDQAVAPTAPDQVADLARQAYALARQDLPDALP
jgi:NAD(P)H-dependent FMN reductase